MNIREQILSLVPTKCPACEGALKLSDDLMHLACQNPNCSGKFYRKLENMVKAFGIENIGIKVAEEMVATLNLEKLHQLYDLTIDDILKVGRFQMGMATKIHNSIQKVREVEWEKFLLGIQLPRVGAGTAYELAPKISNLEELLEISPAKLANMMERATVELTSVIVKGIQDQKEEILELAARVNITYPNGETKVGDKSGVTETKKELDMFEYTPDPTLMAMMGGPAPKPAQEEIKQVKDLSHLTCVITGDLSIPRPTFEKKYNKMYGIKFTTSVSGRTSILITNSTANTGKFKKATSLGVPIKNEQAFVEYIESL